MLKMVRGEKFLMVFLLACVVLVGTVGISEGASHASTSDFAVSSDNQNFSDLSSDKFPSADLSVSKAPVKRPFSNVNCDDLTPRVQRVRCRLTQGDLYKPSNGFVPEACRGTAVQGQCVVLYASVQSCYDLPGPSKDQCFKRAAGFSSSRLVNEPIEGRREKARDYLITLLHDLEERVGEAVVLGSISEEDGSIVIEQIIVVKQLILGGGGASEVRPEVQALKLLWGQLL